MTAFEISIIGPALFAGILVLATHVPLGAEVLRRGIIFIDLAIAQVAGLGVIAADTMGWDQHGYMVQISAVSAALIAALILNWTDRHWPEIQEALIGVCFILAAAPGILVLAGNPHGGEHLKELLVGQILWVNFDNLLPVTILTAVILTLWYLFRDRLRGVYLVFASLIIPAIATRRIESRALRLGCAYGVGITGYLAGLVLSTRMDLPAGAVIVWCLAVAAMVFAWAIEPAIVRK
jgi:zinc/manganese transport system permease protein